MTPEQQVCSLELAKTLKQLGVPQNSIFCWEWSHTPGEMANLVYWDDHEVHDHQPWIYSAFTVAELGEMLPLRFARPDGHIFNFEETKWAGSSPDEILYSVQYMSPLRGDGGYELAAARQDVSEANARAQMLIYLLENDLIPALVEAEPHDLAA